nr:site-specific DNA-methyltransferase [Paludisphaera mucosa]
MGTGTSFRLQHEFIVHFVLSSPEFHSNDVPSVLRHPRVAPSRRHHENEKPVELLKQLIGLTSPPDGWVLDPFAGSFNVGFACHDLGRNFVGCDLNLAHVEAARARRDGLKAIPIAATAATAV